MLIEGIGHQIVRARLICAVMDLPAKALVLNCNQYNGAFGCSVCKNPGQMVRFKYLICGDCIIETYLVGSCRER